MFEAKEEAKARGCDLTRLLSHTKAGPGTGGSNGTKSLNGSKRRASFEK